MTTEDREAHALFSCADFERVFGPRAGEMAPEDFATCRRRIFGHFKEARPAPLFVALFRGHLLWAPDREGVAVLIAGVESGDLPRAQREEMDRRAREADRRARESEEVARRAVWISPAEFSPQRYVAPDVSKTKE